MTDLSGWIIIGHYGKYQLYAKGDKRRILEAKTGQFICEYEVANESIGHSENLLEVEKANTNVRV